MKKNEIIGLGADASAAEKILALHNEELSRSFIPKNRFEQVMSEKKKLEETVSERDRQLEALKSSGGNIREMKKQIAELQDQNKKAAAEHRAEMTRLRMDGVINSTLASAGAKNIRAVRALFDESCFRLLEDGAVFGLKEALDSVKTSDPYLFKENDDAPHGMTGFQPKVGNSPDIPDINTMTYSQYISALQKNSL